MRVDVLPRAGGAAGLGEPEADRPAAVRGVVVVGNPGAVGIAVHVQAACAEGGIAVEGHLGGLGSGVGGAAGGVPLAQIAEPPPPPPKTETDNDNMASVPAVANSLPPLELPPSSGNLGSIEVPKTDTNEFGWNLDLSMPSFSGRSSKALSENLGTEANPPILLYQPDLASYYPSRARRARITGKTQVSLEISAKGEVTSIRIIKSTPEGVFERAARRAAKKLNYRPSIRNGRPQSSKVSMEFIWKLD